MTKIAMMWTTNHFPAAMRSLSPSTRAKAIEIANGLLAQGQLDKQAIVAISVEEARRWARRSQKETDIISRHPRPFL